MRPSISGHRYQNIEYQQRLSDNEGIGFPRLGTAHIAPTLASSATHRSQMHSPHPDSLDKFFAGIADTMRTFPKHEIAKIKLQISTLVGEAEVKLNCPAQSSKEELSHQATINQNVILGVREPSWQLQRLIQQQQQQTALEGVVAPGLGALPMVYIPDLPIAAIADTSKQETSSVIFITTNGSNDIVHDLTGDD